MSLSPQYKRSLIPRINGNVIKPTSPWRQGTHDLSRRVARGETYPVWTLWVELLTWTSCTGRKDLSGPCAGVTHLDELQGRKDPVWTLRVKILTWTSCTGGRIPCGPCGWGYSPGRVAQGGRTPCGPCG